MKCELCHKAEAQMAITRKVNGVEQELYVCKACAEAGHSHSSPKTSQDPKKDGHHPQVTVFNGKETKQLPDEMVQGLVEATLDFMKGVAEIEENEKHVCPGCKSNWDKIKASGRITCPACWKTFGKKIRAEFLAAEYGPRHVGAAPAVEKLADAPAMRQVLERELQDCIAREDYLRAAEIKRRLDQLGPDTNPKETK